MKMFIVFILITVFALPAFAQENQNRGTYYSALSTQTSNDVVLHTFMIDMYIQEHCKETWPLKELGEVSNTNIQVLLSLKDGNYEKAKSIIKNIKCKNNANK